MKKSKGIITLTNPIRITYVLISFFLLLSCGKSSPKINEEIKKFSTISDITLGMDFSDVNEELNLEKAEGYYEKMRISEKEINYLEGDILLFIHNNAIEKIKFVSSGVFLGDIGAGSFVFNNFLQEREEWVENAMSYYEIPIWEKDGDFYSFEKHGVVHRYTLNKITRLGIMMGWNLVYEITFKKAIEAEVQRGKDNLKF